MDVVGSSALHAQLHRQSETLYYVVIENRYFIVVNDYFKYYLQQFLSIVTND